MNADTLLLLRYQSGRGPLPASLEGLSAFLLSLQRRLPEVEVALSPADGAAVSRLRALGLRAELQGSSVVVHFPADGDALDRTLSLLGLSPLPAGGAAAVLAALEAAPDPAATAPPPLSLPLRIQPAKASTLGWSSEPFSLTLLISNVALRQHAGALLPTQRGPVVGVCAEYGRPLTSLDPPGVAEYPISSARSRGVPMLKLSGGGLLSRPLRLEATSPLLRAPASRPEAVARAEKFLRELDDAWEQRVGPGLEVAWPVFLPARGGPLLDGVGGTPLPEMELQ
jgi:hypothetical protein